ncbi:MAG TPA: hypothetical protein VFM70_10535 [Salinimicrobium sp.]|nr:hypothetical protein [Salinimicrobium sp.]
MNKQKIIDNVAILLEEIPSSMEIVKDDSRKKQRFRYLAEHMVNKAIEKDALITSEDLKGVAILFKTNSKDSSFWKDLMQDLKLAYKVTGIANGLRILKTQKYIKDQRPKEGDYLYCWFWGVLQEARGSDEAKIAYDMKNQFFEKAKKLQLPIYAETRNRRISLAYRRYGFEVFNEWQHPSGDIMYFMRYNPPQE